MKKVVLLGLMICIVGFVYFEIIDRRQSSEVERYYNGIGVRLYHVQTYNTIVAHPQGDGPAARAGLRYGDVINKVDGQDASDMGVGGITEYIGVKSVGDSVNLIVSRYEEDGITLSEELDIDVAVDVIDNANWMLNLNGLTNSMSVGTSESRMGVQFTTSVSKDQDTGKFTYKYVVSSTFDKQVYVELELLEGLGLIDSYIEPSAGGEAQFYFTTEDFPVESYTPFNLYERNPHWFTPLKIGTTATTIVPANMS